MPKNSHSALQLLEVYSIGRKIRSLRTQKHMTLSRLAADNGGFGFDRLVAGKVACSIRIVLMAEHTALPLTASRVLQIFWELMHAKTDHQI